MAAVVLVVTFVLGAFIAVAIVMGLLAMAAGAAVTRGLGW